MGKLVRDRIPEIIRNDGKNRLSKSYQMRMNS